MTKQQPNMIEPFQAKEPRISKRVRQAVELLASGKAATQKAAAAAVGLSEEHFCRALKKSTAQVFLAQRTRETIARGQARAAARLIQLIDANSEHVSLDASTRVLAINNIAPPAASPHALNLQLNIQPGYVIDLRKPDEQDDPLRIAP